MTELMRVWLVERTYTDRDLIVLIYATPDGTHHLRKEISSTMLHQTTVTAAIEVDTDALQPVDDEETRSRYSAEVERVRANYEPDSSI